MNKLLVGFVLALGFTSSAFAGAEFGSGQATCAEMQSALQADGSITVKYAIGGNTYYADATSCPANKHGVEAFDFASDKKLCRVGYICAINSRGSNFEATVNTPAFAVKKVQKYACFARAHYSVHTHPAVWGDSSTTISVAQKSALRECTRQFGWNASCRLEGCAPARF